MPHSVNANTSNVNHEYIEVEDTARARFVYNDGVFEFYASTSHIDNFDIQIMLITPDKRIVIADYYDCIKNGKHFEIDAYEASKVIKLTLGIYNSKGKTINM